ncbi:MAG: hypothetical protein K0S41_4027 [Anaerocolumna sp.]|jgi:murein DD-endopeptidase MepM/ murein hydrolase activator NlpD|nr:hypothetical protein [Anaerocolumna sp.]
MMNLNNKNINHKLIRNNSIKSTLNQINKKNKKDLRVQRAPLNKPSNNNNNYKNDNTPEKAIYSKESYAKVNNMKENDLHKNYTNVNYLKENAIKENAKKENSTKENSTKENYSKDNSREDNYREDNYRKENYTRANDLKENSSIGKYHTDNYKNDNYKNDNYKNDNYKNDNYKNDNYKNDKYKNDNHKKNNYRKDNNTKDKYTESITDYIKLNHVSLQFYIIIWLFVLFMVGSSYKKIELHMVAEKIINEGIDYDSFRDMKVSKNLIDKVKAEVMDDNKKKNIINRLTLSMMVNEFDLKKTRLLSRKNTKQLYKSLSNNSSFKELNNYYYAIMNDVTCFPVKLENGKSCVTFTDTWNAYRSYGGVRRHEGTDLMANDNSRGIHVIVSMTDGIVEKLGWLEQGGYRIGIRGESGAYYYYAHLDSYAPGIKKGDSVKAGQFIGYMGDSGYGKEGTVGKFDVHLHMGIYVETPFGEMSVNPYSILLYLESK